VTGFTDRLKYAVVVGGGLTIIANASNPSGKSILKYHFENGESTMGLLKGELAPTGIVWLCFVAIR
jgi:hypothetical protein